MNKKSAKPAGDDTPKTPPAPPKSPRRRAREFALQGLYQRRVGGHDEASIEAHLQDSPGFDKADRDFFRHQARRLRKSALALLTISDSLVTGEALPAGDRQTTFTDMMKIALAIA